MYNVEASSPKELLTCFFEECETQFRFLELEHGFTYFSGLVDYRGGRQVITPYKNQDVTGVFLATTRYEKEDNAFEILFGDKDFFLEAYAYYDRMNRFSLSEVLEASKKPDEQITGQAQIHHRELLKDTVQHIAASFKSNAQYLVEPGQKIIERTITMRGKRMEHQLREQYKRIIDAASERAAKAFRTKDYIYVIELLSPYEDDLSPADQKKLERARQNCTPQK